MGPKSKSECVSFMMLMCFFPNIDEIVLRVVSENLRNFLNNYNVLSSHKKDVGGQLFGSGWGNGFCRLCVVYLVGGRALAVDIRKTELLKLA